MRASWLSLAFLIDYQDFSSGYIARGIGHVLPTLVTLAVTKGAGAEGEVGGEVGVAADATAGPRFIVNTS